jgi:hypothetical protein
MIHFALIAALIFLGASLALAVLGAVLLRRPAPPPAEPHAPTPPWAARRCGAESLHNLSPRSPSGGGAGGSGGRMYAAPPSATSLPPGFRRAL